MLKALAFAISFVVCPAALDCSAAQSQGDGEAACTVLADLRVEAPLRSILDEYQHRTSARVRIALAPSAKINALVQRKEADCDVVVCMHDADEDRSAVSRLPNARTVAWKHPTGQPVWAATRTENAHALPIVRFLGGPTGHRLWSESEAGFTITSGETAADAYEWVAENRTSHTYPLTAKRMLRECGGIRKGICIDVGCGPGHLDVELAKRSDFTIVGLDINPDMGPLFEKRIRAAGLADRVSFVVGDAQEMPFPDDYADVIVSRGTLIFIPDIAKCLREVHRVLKPTGIAFLGGRYVYTPRAHKISTEKLKEIVQQSGVAGAQVIETRGQWVKIVGPQAPQAARQFQGSPQMLADRILADYAITRGNCLLILRGDGGLEQALQKGLVDMTDLTITALYPTEEAADSARRRIAESNLAARISCRVGDIEALPFADRDFDLVAGVGPVLIWRDRVKAMREVYRVLRSGGAALVGGRYLHMPEFRRVSSEALRTSAAETGIQSIRVIDDMGQWVEIRKGIGDRGFAD